MATRLYGVLLDGLKKPIVNATVVLLAKGNTITVLNGSEAIFKTDAQGAYNITVQSGYYKVIIGPQGIEPYKAGEIAIYADSPEGSLNSYLVNWAEEDLTPEVIKQVKELVAISEQYSLQAGRSAAAAQADATDARNSKASAAQSASDALTYKNDSKANADAAKQAQAGAAGSANTANSAVTEVNKIKTDTQKIKDDAVKEVSALKDAASTSANTATEKATQAGQSATTAGQHASTATEKANIATQKADAAKAAADRAESAAEGSLKKAQNLSDLTNINTARTNIQVDRLTQAGSETAIHSPSKQAKLFIENNTSWGAFDVTNSKYLPLPINRGGTGALTPADARINLAVFAQSYTSLSSTKDLNTLTGPYLGVYWQGANANATPENNYPVARAGALIVLRTNANTAHSCIQIYYPYNTSHSYYQRYYDDGTKIWGQWAEFHSSDDTTYWRTKLLVDRFQQGSTTSYMYSTITNTSPRLQVNDQGLWGCHNGTNWVPLGLAQGGTGAVNAQDARANINAIGIGESGLAKPITEGLTSLSSLTEITGCGFYNLNGDGTANPTIGAPPGSGNRIVACYVIPVRNDTALLFASTYEGRKWTGLFNPKDASVVWRDEAQEVQYIKTLGSQDGVQIQVPSGSAIYAHLCYQDQNGKTRWRASFNRDNSNYELYSYYADGTYYKSPLKIEPSGTMILSGLMYCNSNIYQGNQYQYTSFRGLLPGGSQCPDDRVAGNTMFEVSLNSDGSNSYVYLFRRRKDGNRTGEILVQFPQTAGMLALQGTSGREYKKNISGADTKEALERIMSLEMVNFIYKDDPQSRIRFGIIAEDAERTAPQYVKHNKEPIEDILDEDGNIIDRVYRDRPSIDTNPIVMDLLGAIQNQQKQIEEQQKQINELKDIISTLIEQPLP